MHYLSTRNTQIRKTLSEAIQLGLASDGGLFVPEKLPNINIDNFTLANSKNLSKIATETLKEFFADDILLKELPSICANAFNFPVPLRVVDENTFMLELYHGPTSSFKDFGARFLAECINSISNHNKVTILVATSGDTGSAVASAFYEKENINVIILYPKNRISVVQEKQIASFGRNILALAVEGSFDDCQSIVKSAFADPWWQQTMNISSANSINIGRLLPQITYYAFTSLNFYQQFGIKPGFIIPTGNLGNATAAFYAKEMGFPIREIALTTNANKVLWEYREKGEFTPQVSLHTLANAMDVGNPSNFERVLNYFKTYESFKNNVKVTVALDQDIINALIDTYKKYQIIICPHTATAFHARKEYSQNEPWIIVATAEPGKFDNHLIDILGVDFPISHQLQEYLSKPILSYEVSANIHDVRRKAEDYFLK